MTAIRKAIAAITEDRRAAYLFDTKIAAQAVGMGANKFGEYWYRTRRKLIELYIAQPGQTAAELAILAAEAEEERQFRGSVAVERKRA